MLLFIVIHDKVMEKHNCIQSFGVKNILMSGVNKISLTMRIALFMLFCMVGFASADNSYAQKTMLNITPESKVVREVLNEVEQQSDFTFFYNNNEVDVTRKVSVNVKSGDIFTVLDKVFKGTGVSYKVLDKSIILSARAAAGTSSSEGINQAGNIKGKVVDAAGDPIIGANIIVVGTTNGTISDID